MRKFGVVSAIEVFNDPDAPWVILFHGFGADAYDLAGLVDLIPVKGPVNWLFPQGFLSVPIGPGWTGRAWWKIDLEKLQADMAKGIDRDMGAEIPEGLPALRKNLISMIQSLNCPWEKIILGGFSQGGMVAVDLALHAPVNPLGLMILSSGLVNKAEWAPLAAQRKGLPFFQSHGVQDPVIAIKNADRMQSLLSNGGAKGSVMRFQGGHEIPEIVLMKASEYINSRIMSLE